MPVFELYCYCVSTLSVVLNGILLLISSHKSIEAIQVNFIINQVASSLHTNLGIAICKYIFLKHILIKYKIQELRYFLSNVAVAGGCFSICLLLLQPQMVSRGSMTIRVPHGPAQYFSETFVVRKQSTSWKFHSI